ncbi:hypothetical protein BCR42DRAFT_102780 [Absidia repens]|uniref:Uncharacterized protein n=1 Tax=Absidia repens TaxID=90262 RepID=A0A1X2I7L4_9FUNG|nr:hypothetical protein BCR42DRAFT_102780 [Absidia repens]
MQFQTSYSLPFAPSLAKKDWNTSSIYSQLQQQQDMKSKIEALEQKLKHDHQVFEKQRAILLEEIKVKDKQRLENEQQLETRWSTKVQKLQQQLETERKNHEEDICEWKLRYQAAMDTEQQKHYRRLAYFHQRLNAKNMEYAELEQLLARSAPGSPIPSPIDSQTLKPASNTTNRQNDVLSPNIFTTVNRKDNHTTQPQTRHNYRWRRSSSLDSSTPLRTNPPRASQSMIADPVIGTSRQDLETTGRPSNTKKPKTSDLSSLPLVDDLYASELQDMTLRHQASVDNMAAEYAVDRAELLEQHERDRKLWKVEHDSELHNERMRLVQEHGQHLDQVNQSWQQKWDDMVAQNKRSLAELQKQWDEQSKSDKLAWENRKSKEHDAMKKQLGWATYELNLMLKEHKAATILAKQLNLAIDPSTDVEDMKLTLVGLLEIGLQIASELDSPCNHSEKSSEPVSFFGLLNMSF